MDPTMPMDENLILGLFDLMFFIVEVFFNIGYGNLPIGAVASEIVPAAFDFLFQVLSLRLFG